MALEFFSFVLTSFNLLIFNEKPIYFKKNHDGEIWRNTNLDIGPWHNISVSTRHVKTCFDVNYSSNNIGARDNKNYYSRNRLNLVMQKQNRLILMIPMTKIGSPGFLKLPPS